MDRENRDLMQRDDVRDAVMGEYIPTVMSSDQNLTMWQLDAQDIITILENDLKGKKFDAESEEWIDGGEPLLNNTGIREITSLCSTVINKVVFLSNLSEEHVYRISRVLANDITQLLFNNIDRFEIKHKSSLSLIVSKVSWLIFVSLQRAREEGERRFLKSAERRIINIRQEPKQKKGFWIFGKGGD